MLKAIKLMKRERAEQLSKHGRTIEHDREFNHFGQLVKAAMYCVEKAETGKCNVWPSDWSLITKGHLDKKSPKELVVYAGAFLMAEQDRIEAKIYWQEIMQLAWLYERLKKQP